MFTDGYEKLSVYSRAARRWFGARTASSIVRRTQSTGTLGAAAVRDAVARTVSMPYRPRARATPPKPNAISSSATESDTRITALAPRSISACDCCRTAASA